MEEGESLSCEGSSNKTTTDAGRQQGAGRVAGRGTHQLMEAAINNAGVVYHSDPRLILAYLAAGQAGVLSS